MQVLKNDIKSNILNAAIYEFKINGYEKASIRDIAKRAETSVGNLYRYFNNKESLFDEIVSSIYETIINNNFPIKHDEELEKLVNINLLAEKELIDYFLSMHKSYREEIYLLLFRSQGSKYENTKENLIAIIEKWYEKFFYDVFNKEKTITRCNVLSKALATSMMEGLCTILAESEDDKEFIENIIQYMEFTFRSTIRSAINMKEDSVNYRRISYEEIIHRISNHCNYSHNSNTTNH